jgi:hypothetical protein
MVSKPIPTVHTSSCLQNLFFHRLNIEMEKYYCCHYLPVHMEECPWLWMKFNIGSTWTYWLLLLKFCYINMDYTVNMGCFFTHSPQIVTWYSVHVLSNINTQIVSIKTGEVCHFHLWVTITFYEFHIQQFMVFSSYNGELCGLYRSVNIFGMVKCMRLWWAGCNEIKKEYTQNFGQEISWKMVMLETENEMEGQL